MENLINKLNGFFDTLYESGCLLEEEKEEMNELNDDIIHLITSQEKRINELENKKHLVGMKEPSRTWWNSQIHFQEDGGKEYNIQFGTHSKRAYQKVEEACADAIDQRFGNAIEWIPVVKYNWIGKLVPGGWYCSCCGQEVTKQTRFCPARGNEWKGENK